MNEAESTRRYSVVSLIGEGGFGKVYRARMEGPGGFTKEVAIKLLHDEDFPESVRRRFRDEARILGLVRDRAIVGVDPPVLLSGSWAIVMEYVDGVSASWLVKRGALPLTVALEIVQESVRALDTVYRQEGPNGTPLRLVHRDLKPGNLQITPTGAVKVLDFGIARAEFGGREAQTRRHVGGTFGYIAPERLEGIDGPEGDVYAMGVVLHELVLGRRPGVSHRSTTYSEDDVTRPRPAPLTDGSDPATEAVLELSTQMRSLEPEDRPTTRDVERKCAALIKTLDGPTLRHWAEEHVPAGSPMEPDARVGTQLSETPQDPLSGASTAPGTQPTAGNQSRSLALVAAAAVIVLLVLGGLTITSAGVLGAALWANTPPAELQPPVPSATPQPSPDPVAPAPTPDPVAPAPTPNPTPAPSPVAPVPNPVAPAPIPAAPAPRPAATFSVTLTSVPLGATVIIDGQPFGRTPVTSPLSAGSHVIRMEFGGVTSAHSIRVGRRAPSRYVWRSEGDVWDSIF